MKFNLKIVSICFYLIIFHSAVCANEISEYEIEGISVGDSLLNFFTKNKIENFINYDDQTNTTFRILEFSKKEYSNLTNYDSMQIYHKPKDDEYIVFGVRGIIFCETKQICINKHKNIIKDLKNSFSNFNSAKKEKFKHPSDKTGKSEVELIFLDLDNGYIAVRYTNWSEKMDYSDNVDVEVATTEVENWLRNNYGNN